MYLVYNCTNIYNRFTSVFYLRAAEAHMHCIRYEQKTRNRQFLHFVESVLTSICGGTQHYVLKCELVSISWGKPQLCMFVRDKITSKFYASGLTGKLPWLLGNSTVSSTDVPNHQSEPPTPNRNKYATLTLHVNSLVSKTCRQCLPPLTANSPTSLTPNEEPSWSSVEIRSNSRLQNASGMHIARKKKKKKKKMPVILFIT